MRFDQPVGTQVERDAARAWAGQWFDATGYGDGTVQDYGSYHTGADLNLPAFADTKAPVYASASGVVVFVGVASGFQVQTVVIAHGDVDGVPIWTRYAHITDVRVTKNQLITRGTQLGVIGDYLPAGVSNDHLHFDVARIDLGAKPADWPGNDLARLTRDYLNPLDWINAHRVDASDDDALLWTPTDTALGSRARLTPDTVTTTNIAGVIGGGAVVPGKISADKKWVNLNITPVEMRVGGVRLSPSVNNTFAGFAAREFMKPAPTSPPPPPLPVTVDARKLLGVHELANAGRARGALALGARCVMVFEDAIGAMQMADAYRDAIVMHRKYFTVPLSPVELLAQHGINVNETSQSRAWYRGYNENDVGGGFDSSPSGIRKRAMFDLDCAALLKRAAPNAVWVAGGWAHGNPDFTNADVCAAIRDGYAAAYNRGEIAFDLHNYSKSNPANPKDYRYYAPEWFEARFQFLFTKCGFDPKVRRIVSSEGGIEAGAGGFRWAGFSPGEFDGWMSYVMKVLTQAVIVSGVTYPSPFVGMSLFQWGNNSQSSGGWWGYGLDEYTGRLKAAYDGLVVADRTQASVDLHAGAAPDTGYHPPAKIMELG